MEKPTIRDAASADLPAINDIYNHYVRHSTCTYQLQAETMADRQAWFERHGPGHPVIVAQAGGEILGWGCLSPLHSREAYRFTVENSVYARADSHRQGIGQMLLAELIGRARQAGHHSIIAIISADQDASIALHAKLGFVEVGRFREVGFKFDRWLDVVYMQLRL